MVSEKDIFNVIRVPRRSSAKTKNVVAKCSTAGVGTVASVSS